MGNKIHQGVLFKEKILKILQNPLNEGELRVRLLDIFNLQISEQSLIESLENTDIHNGIEKCPDNIKFIIQFIIESILVLSEKKSSLTVEEIVILKSLLMFLSRFIPIIYEVEKIKFYKLFPLSSKNMKNFVKKYYGKIILIYQLMKFLD